VLRDSKTKPFSVKISERPEREKLAMAEKTGKYFGMTVQEITPEIAKHFGLPNTNGVIVSEVKEGSPSGEAGIQPEDIILQINRAKIFTLKDYSREMSKANRKNSALLLVKRGAAKLFVVIRK